MGDFIANIAIPASIVIVLICYLVVRGATKGIDPVLYYSGISGHNADLTLDFLDMTGLRALISLNRENQEAKLHCNMVCGPTLRRLTRVVADHGLPIVDSVPEALQLIEEAASDRDIPS